MLINGVALLASAIMMTVYLWKVVPQWVVMFSGVNLALPLATRFTIAISDWSLTLALPLLATALLLFFFRRRIQFPEWIRSGAALTIVTGFALLLVQLGWLALLMESHSVVGEAYKVAGPATRVNRAILAMRSGNYDAALMDLRISLRRLAESGAPDAPLSISTSLLMGDAYAKTGDKERARESYEQALRQVKA